MFKREINRRWGLIAARALARLLIERIQILVFGYDDVTELGAQACQRQFY
jgi:ADP-heptose:LPS heptosyltransferase